MNTIQTIFITNRIGNRDLRVRAVVKNGIALHPSPLFSPPKNNLFGTFGLGYTVTHVKSGVALGAFLSRDIAVNRFNILADGIVAGIAIGDLPVCELCNVAAILAEMVKPAISGEKLRKNADYISDALNCNR